MSTTHGRELVAGDRFCFSSDSIPSVDLDNETAYGIAFGTWPDGAGVDKGFAFGAWAKWPDGVDVGSESHVDADAKLPANNYFPSPRVQTIARRRREMLDSMKDVPDYAYELSLRDLVELPRIAMSGQDSPARERMSKSKVGWDNKVKGGRNSKFEIKGFFLKIFFPIPTTSSRRSSNRGPRSSGESIRSTTTLLKDGGNANAAGKDGGSDWLENQKLAILNRDPSRSGTPSHNSCMQKRRPRGCYHFFPKNKNKSSKF